MFDERHDDSIVQRGIDEALACQDMLARTPMKSSWVSQMVAWIVAAVRLMAHRGMDSEPQTAAAAPHGTQ